MNTNELIRIWKAEEEIAHIHGWDFSHIAGRYTEAEDLPWDYRAVIREQLRPEMKLLDIDTGGGEFLLSLGHPHENTAAMENHPPNVELCKELLLPLGIDFRPGDGKGKLPFDDGRFEPEFVAHCRGNIPHSLVARFGKLVADGLHCGCGSGGWYRDWPSHGILYLTIL